MSLSEYYAHVRELAWQNKPVLSPLSDEHDARPRELKATWKLNAALEKFSMDAK